MANSNMKRCSTSLAIRDMQIKTIMRYHLPERQAEAGWRQAKGGEMGTLVIVLTIKKGKETLGFSGGKKQKTSKQILLISLGIFWS